MLKFRLASSGCVYINPKEISHFYSSSHGLVTLWMTNGREICIIGDANRIADDNWVVKDRS